MAFNESFWVATSAVAPVIALAAVVTLPDVSLIGRANNLRATLEQRRLSEDFTGPLAFLAREARDAAKWASFASLTTLVNLIIQASLLAVSLCALAFEQDIMPFWLAISLAIGGILLLALSTLVSAVQRWTLENGIFRKGGEADSYLAANDSADNGP